MWFRRDNHWDFVIDQRHAYPVRFHVTACGIAYVPTATKEALEEGDEPCPDCLTHERAATAWEETVKARAALVEPSIIVTEDDDLDRGE